MQINHTKTKERCKVLNRAALAAEFGCSRVLVCQVIDGTYRFMHAEMAQKILVRLREMGLLVEEADGPVNKAA